MPVFSFKEEEERQEETVADVEKTENETEEPEGEETLSEAEQQLAEAAEVFGWENPRPGVYRQPLGVSHEGI